MLLGALWKDKHMMVVGLNETIYFLDPLSPARPHKVIQVRASASDDAEGGGG
jgi:hypothetical protein